MQQARGIAGLVLAALVAAAQQPAPPGGAIPGTRAGNPQNGANGNGGGAAANQGAVTSQGTGKFDLEQLRAQLAQQGREGAEAREGAIEQLLSCPTEAAHALLCARLADPDDADNVRSSVLQALARRLRNAADSLFGQRPENADLRSRLQRQYTNCLCPFWLGTVDVDGLLPADPLRDLARVCIERLPPRVLKDSLRTLVLAADTDARLRVAALRCAGDSQDLILGDFLAEFVESTDPALQTAARTALRYLTFAETPFERRDQYEAWYQANRYRRYQDLAEQAARSVARRVRQFDEERKVLRREAACEFVRTATERRNGVDWAAVQARTLVDDPATMGGCLQQLRRTLGDAVPGDEGAAARQTFTRALLVRYRGAPADDVAGRAAMIEVAAYLCRPAETELSLEVSSELVQQLDAPTVDMQLAALRALRRFPSTDARAAVVRTAAAALVRGDAHAGVLAQALQTLSWSKEPTWRAPIDNANDKAAWLQLLRDVCSGSLPKERRNEALAVALLTDRDNKRVSEVFDLLLEIGRDRTREPEFRTQCLIHLQDWKDQEGRADTLVRALTGLLGDDDRDVRQFAAEALQRLPDAPEDKKRGWQYTIALALRDRLPTENNAAVLQAMAGCLVACGREPSTPETVIGPINGVLDAIGLPVPQEQEFRVKTLLAELPTVAADPRAEQGQWIGACDMLLKHEERRSLRHVLESHNAVALGKEIGNADTRVVDRARRVLRFILLAALMKPAKEAWLSTDELKHEAEDVRAAFAALPPNAQLPENIQEPRFRLLRLEVLIAGGKAQEALQLAGSYLREVDPKDHPPLDPAQQDAVRLFAAEASLVENKNDQAADWLAQIDPSRANEPRALEVAERTSRAFTNTNPAKAEALLDRIVRATQPEDPAFRGRLVSFLQVHLRTHPTEREEVQKQLNRYAALFQGADCPEVLKEAVAELRRN